MVSRWQQKILVLQPHRAQSHPLTPETGSVPFPGKGSHMGPLQVSHPRAPPTDHHELCSVLAGYTSLTCSMFSALSPSPTHSPCPSPQKVAYNLTKAGVAQFPPRK